jgi:hypothetical protein
MPNVIDDAGNYDDSIGNNLPDCQCGYTDPADNYYARLSYQYTYRKTSRSGAGGSPRCRARSLRHRRQARPLLSWQPAKDERVFVGKRDAHAPVGKTLR